MDASVGQFNWKTGGLDDQKKKKKERKKPHWLIAKEAGKKKKGSEKRREKRLKEKEARDGDEEHDEEDRDEQKKMKIRKVDREIAASLSKQSAEDQCSYVWGEVEDVTQEKRPSAESFVCCSDEEGDFGERVKSVIGDEKEWSDICRKRNKHEAKAEAKKSPRILVIAPGAVRCIALINELKTAMGENASTVAKLFAKHIKIEDQQKLLQSSFVGKSYFPVDAFIL